MTVAELIDLGGDLRLRLTPSDPPEGIFAGDYYPTITLRIEGRAGHAEVAIDPAKAQEISMALRVAAARSQGRR